MPEHRTERDALGELRIPADCLHGIHTARALHNFPLTGRPPHPMLIRAFGAVKLACAQANRQLGYLDGQTYPAITRACEEMIGGQLESHIMVDAMQGGAGTSTNLNVNEVLANRALQILGRQPGDYHVVDPLQHLNLHQSTNDTYPTALKIAAIRLLREFEERLTALQEAFQGKEREFADVVKIGRTELRDAVPTTMGRSMGAYAEAFARDRWRIYKSEERLRTVNLGGTAIGSGLGAPREYIFKATDNLRKATGIGLARAENLIDATQNHDLFAEVAGILAAAAVNLKKCANDLRWLASGPQAGLGELRLPPVQAGSSIMPHKFNPVIAEAAVQAATATIADCQLVTQTCAMGELELNAFLPLLADRLLHALELSSRTADIFARLCVAGLQVHRQACARQIAASSAVATALISRLGYRVAAEIAGEAEDSGRTIRELVVERKLLAAAEFDDLIAPEAVSRLGFTRPGLSPD